MPWNLVCATKMSYSIFLLLGVTEEVQGLMRVSEFMFNLTLGINVSEWLDTGPHRLNSSWHCIYGLILRCTTLDVKILTV